MRSLYRGSVVAPVAMAVHSCAMGISPLLMFLWRAKRHEKPGAVGTPEWIVFYLGALRVSRSVCRGRRAKNMCQVAGWSLWLHQSPLASVVGSLAYRK